MPGQAHSLECDIGLCRQHGERRAWCMGDGDHSPTTYRGVYPGTDEAVSRGWFATSPSGERIPDINRVISELTWDPTSESYV